ncbi:MAG: RluA family pseudouridine synthase [Saprospiraceae bacterium]
MSKIDNIGELVLYKNNQFIAFNKPPTVPVQADKTGDTSLLQLAEIYTKSKLDLVHRIDRPASGVVLIAKNKKSLAAVQRQFQERTIKKTYLAVVKNLPESASGELVHFLKKNGRRNRSVVQSDATKGGKKAALTYEVLGSSDNYHLLKIELQTGRFHQIRAQLAAMDNPIKGDVKYGFRRNNSDRSIQLHAWKLRFTHPVSGERETIVAPPPADSIWAAFGHSFE